MDVAWDGKTRTINGIPVTLYRPGEGPGAGFQA